MAAKTLVEISTGETFLYNEDSMKKTTFIYKRGTNAVLNFRLLDENRQPVALDGCLVTITVRRGNRPPVIDALPCSIGVNQQFAGKGTGSFNFDGTVTEIARGTYDLEITVTDALGNSLKFPNNQKEPFAALIVQEPLS